MADRPTHQVYPHVTGVYQRRSAATTDNEATKNPAVMRGSALVSDLQR